MELIKRKSSIWAYEREWRYIKSKDECDKDRFGYYKTINKLAVQDIIAGCKIDKNRLKEIIHIVHCNYTDKLKLKIAVPNGYNYRLDIVEYERISTFLPYESNM